MKESSTGFLYVRGLYPGTIMKGIRDNYKIAYDAMGLGSVPDQLLTNETKWGGQYGCTTITAHLSGNVFKNAHLATLYRQPHGIAAHCESVRTIQ